MGKKRFDPNDIGVKTGGIFGLPFSYKDTRVAILPVPWEATASYRPGAAKGPQAVFEASLQVDLYDSNIKDAWKTGIYMEPVSQAVYIKSCVLRKKTEACIVHLESGGNSSAPKFKALTAEVNRVCAELDKWVRQKSEKYLSGGKIPCVLGGDHSAPLGLMQAVSARYDSFGILHIDAHADLRDKYEGFEFSHASIMFNALKLKQVRKLVQIGVRDYSEDEADLIKNSKGRIQTFFFRDTKKALFEGKTWASVCAEIIAALPKDVYISFDIDAMDPSLCPNTGTPVPGGFMYEEIMYLLAKLASCGRRIIGFDLCEVAPGKNTVIDAAAGARILYKMANLAALSQR